MQVLSRTNSGIDKQAELKSKIVAVGIQRPRGKFSESSNGQQMLLEIREFSQRTGY
jgi:hypothetical protein